MKRDDKFLKALGKVVAARRKQLGISQEELAHRSQINRTYIGDIERGARNIALLNVKKLCAGLDIGLSSLFANVEKTLARDIQA